MTSSHRVVFRRVAGAALSLTAIALLAVLTATPGTAASSPMHSGRQAVSPGVLNALAVRSGAIKPSPGFGPSGGGAAPGVTILPNVRASNNGSSFVDEVPITADPNNSAHLETGGNDFNCSNIQGFYNSDDSGATWPHQHCLTNLSGLLGDGDPNVAYDLSGNAYILGIDSTSSLTNGVIAFQKSANNGVSWSTVAAGPTHFYTNGLTDKEWTEVDRTATSPFAGCLYTSITQFDTSFNDETITVDHSCNGGTTWSGPVAVSAQAVFPTVRQFSDLAVGKDGTVYATWIKCVANGSAGDCGGTVASVEYSKSTNGGVSWTTPTVIHTVTLAPDSCFCAFYGNIPGTSERVSDIPVIDIDNSAGSNAGTLYVVDYNYTGGKIVGQVTTSSNGGTSWTTPVVVNPLATSDTFFHWLSVNPLNGRVGVSYGLRSGGSFNWYAAIAAPGAPSFKNKKLSTVASNFSMDGEGGGFIGDYSGNIWANNAFHVSWPDTRSGNAQDETGGFQF